MEARATATIPRGDIERYHAAAVEMAGEARRIVRSALAEGFDVETKPDQSPVTDVDRAVERRLRERIDDLVARGLATPVWCVIDGHPGLRKAAGLVWPRALVQRCCVHKLRNLERKAPKHALAEIRADFHRIIYAESATGARVAYAAFERKWTPRCSGVVRSLQEGGEELLTFFQFPKRQWKALRTTNVIERLNEEFGRRVRTQGALPTEDAALVLLFGLVVSGQIRLRRLDGWRQIPAVLTQRRRSAA